MTDTLDERIARLRRIVASYEEEGSNRSFYGQRDLDLMSEEMGEALSIIAEMEAERDRLREALEANCRYWDGITPDRNNQAQQEVQATLDALADLTREALDAGKEE